MTESEMIKKAIPVCLEPLNDKYRHVIKKALEDVQMYMAIGTVEECRLAMEKMKPKPPVDVMEDYGTFECPSCGGLIYAEDRLETHKYCLLCGQALSW